MELENKINNIDLNIEEKQNKFFNTFLGKTVNSAIDIGLKTILPDLIENQIIDIKNSLLENGLRGGIRTAVDSTLDLAKSTVGIFTGNFENMNQVKIAIGNKGIIDTISTVLDKAIDKIYELGIINDTVNSMIKSGKDIILDNVTNNIKNELDKQINSFDELEKYIDNWKNYYNNKDFIGMSKEYTKIEKQLENIVPIENIIKETRRVEAIHNLIKNNGQNFEITELEKELAEKIQ